MKGLYLASYKAYHPNYNLDYNDIQKTSKHINVIQDMLTVDLTKYDYIIATPPCNYWSKARGNRKPSHYAINTKDLLPMIINKLIDLDKPFIVENVRNKPVFIKEGLYNISCFIYHHGRHTYWTNVPFNPTIIKQNYDFKYGGVRLVNNTQGGDNVHNVIEYWLEIIHIKEKKND